MYEIQLERKAADFPDVVFHLYLHGHGRVSILAMVIMGDLVKVGDIVRGVGQPSREKHTLHLQKHVRVK